MAPHLAACLPVGVCRTLQSESLHVLCERVCVVPGLVSGCVPDGERRLVLVMARVLGLGREYGGELGRHRVNRLRRDAAGRVVRMVVRVRVVVGGGSRRRRGGSRHTAQTAGSSSRTALLTSRIGRHREGGGGKEARQGRQARGARQRSVCRSLPLLLSLSSLFRVLGWWLPRGCSCGVGGRRDRAKSVARQKRASEEQWRTDREDETPRGQRAGTGGESVSRLSAGWQQVDGKPCPSRQAPRERRKKVPQTATRTRTNDGIKWEIYNQPVCASVSPHLCMADRLLSLLFHFCR